MFFSEPRGNSLRHVVEEAVLNHLGFIAPDLPELANIIKDASPMARARTRGELMTRILLLGLDPETVDFSDPVAPGRTAEKVRAGIAVVLRQFTDRGWESDVGLICPDETAGPTVEQPKILWAIAPTWRRTPFIQRLS